MESHNYLVKCVIVGVLLFSLTGCGLMGPSNKKTIVETQRTDIDGRLVTDTTTTYERSDTGSYNDAVVQIVNGGTGQVDPNIQLLADHTKCENCTDGEKTWANAAFAIGLVAIKTSESMMRGQAIRDLKQPKEWADVWYNAIDRNTIPLVASLGLAGWITESLSGALGSNYNFASEGGDMSFMDSLNRSELHLTGSPFDNGASFNSDFMSRVWENAYNTAP